MRILAQGGALGAIALLVSMCGGQAPMVASTPRPEAPSRITPLAPPAEKLTIPVPEVGWTPVSYRSRGAKSLIAVLREHQALAVILPRKGNPAELENRVFRMLKAVSPEIRIVARGTAMLDHLFEERGDIPNRVTLEPGGTDAEGRPYYLPKNHPLNTDWLSKKRAMKGADAMLVVRPVTITDLRLKELQDEKQGSCAAFEKALGAGIDSGRNYFATYIEKASSMLLAEFKQHLKVALPFWRDELSRISSLAESGSLQAQCHDAYAKLLDTYEKCLSSTCAGAPRLFADEGGIAGMPDPGLLVPPSCPVAGMRDYAAELNDLADRTVVEVLPALDVGWAAELARFGGLTRIAKTVSEGCRPKHRRFHPEDITRIQEETRAFLTKLGTQELNAVWESVGGMARISGVGPVKVLARVKVSTGDPTVAATAIEQALRRAAHCSSGNGRVMQAVVVNVGGAEVEFMGWFFEEQLLCEDFPPQ